MRCKCQKVAQRCDALWEWFYFAEQSPHSEPSGDDGYGISDVAEEIWEI